MAYYQDQKFKIHPEVYTPAEDSFLIADNLDVRKDEEVLEIGTGCGLLAILAAQAGAKVLATDVNPKAIECAKENAQDKGVADQIEFKLGDLFKPIGERKFDLIIFNPPYLPVSRSELTGIQLEKAWAGGSTGRKIIDRFLDDLLIHLEPEGRSLFVQSSLSGIRETFKKLHQMELQVTTKTEKLSFERIYLFQVSKA
ncbi:hypothetical protein AKJ47_02200 [candidate division MSBL1 archaeon SCGC-AAA261G05]|uniref:Methyltransferase small domain-containing protein n=2 Tax=candidate division MSBL1 TaxID=215777 RepID=A0A133VAN3_9EURY|nr:hypothetical protein AKJ47_02200 [candidate division MSBL1 archaeon SCGC-AAA261G05]KXB05060.1 hypothetical protein AKJ48_00325 [candidate division MSBL1 archaeon SCGC-AAA261O19]